MGFVSRVWKDQVWGGLILATILAVCGIVWAHVKGYLTWALLVKVASAAWGLVIYDLHVPAYALALSILVAFFAGARLSVSYLRRIGQLIETAPPQVGYLTDVLYGVRLRWDVMSNGDVAVRRMYCTECDNEVGLGKGTTPGTTSATCGHCGHRAEVAAVNPPDLFNKAKREIERRIRTGEWRKLKRGRRSSEPRPGARERS
jgi:hypothetical protein